MIKADANVLALHFSETSASSLLLHGAAIRSCPNAACGLRSRRSADRCAPGAAVARLGHPCDLWRC
ncbi:unnamed protein product [Alopecurus aequalis]